MPAGSRFIYQPEGGFITSERAIIAHANEAMAQGAEIHAREPVLHWQATAGGVRVTTARATYEAGRLILATGAWMSELAPLLAGLAIPERQVLAWLQPFAPELFTPACFPVFNLEVEEGRYYGLPIFEVPGFKFGRYHHRAETGAPETIRRPPDAEDEFLLRSFAARYFPQGNGPTMALRDCMFTNTPDEHFIIDQHPEYPQIILASPCSGHGYKFCSVIGELLADLAMHGTTSHDIDFLRLQRLRK
jgi:sarcosine oxidase